jgi:SAM-dependent methyltransferase
MAISNAREIWKSNWHHYVRLSIRGSSSAIITATNFIEMGQITEGSRILDAGCGHGRITELLVHEVPGLDVVGVDLTQPLLDNFLVKSGANASKIELICADIANLPLKDNSFDAVVSSRAFQYLPDPRAAVRDAVRVLKPGGRLVVSMPNKWNPIKYFTHRNKLYSALDLRHWFMQAGLEEIEYRSMCFFPSSTAWTSLALSFEATAKIPVLRYFGGNVLVKGKKKGATPATTLSKPERRG